GYCDAVIRRATEYVCGLSGPDLDRIVDTRWDPPVTLGVRLISVISDDLQHAGQAAYLRGLLRRPYLAAASAGHAADRAAVLQVARRAGGAGGPDLAPDRLPQEGQRLLHRYQPVLGDLLGLQGDRFQRCVAEPAAVEQEPDAARVAGLG